MHDVMRARLLRKLEALPEEQLYQVLDYIDFLESRHSPDGPSRPRGFQRLAERIEDRMRTRHLSPRAIGRAMTVVGTAGRMARTVAAAGREAVRTGRAILDEVESTGSRPVDARGSEAEDSGSHVPGRDATSRNVASIE